MSVQTGKQSKLKMMAVALVTCASMTIIPVASASAAEADVIAPTTESGEYGIRPMWLNPEGKHTQYPAQAVSGNGASGTSRFVPITRMTHGRMALRSR